MSFTMGSMHIRRTTTKVHLLLATVFFTVIVPYLVPVGKTVSLAYVTHFNNRACLLVFVACSCAYAYLTRGEIGVADTLHRNRPLTVVHLFASLLATVLLLWSQYDQSPVHPTAFEALYNINRVYLADAGQHPYTGFEYAYGPLHLYSPIVLAKILHTTVYLAYYINWALQWVTGVAMLWCAVRWLNGALPWRPLVFWGMWLSLVPAIGNEGVSYTALRFFGSAFLLLVVHRVWNHGYKQGRTAAAALLCIAGAFSVSAEQGVGVTSGVLLWFWILRVSGDTRVSRTFIFSLTAAALLLLALLARFAYFAAAQQFSSGAYSFPLTFSLYVTLILLVYIFAACAAFHSWQQKDLTAQSLPLFLGGFAMLPAAFGRSDLGHLQMATPALLLGLAYINGHTQVRRWWGFAYALLLALPGLPAFAKGSMEHLSAAAHNRVGHYRVHHARALNEKLVLSAGPIYSGTTSPISDAPVLSAPCPVVYRTIDVTPEPSHSPSDECIQLGFYFGLENVFTPAAIAHKIDELRADPKRPLLLHDVLTAQLFPIGENDPASLAWLQGALIIPSARNMPLTYKDLIVYVTQHYSPQPYSSNGLRIWTAKE